MLKNVLCVIPARGSGDTVPYINIKEFGNKPLLAHTIEVAKECDFIGRIIVSTESHRIANIAQEYGAEVPFLRPKALSESKANLNDVIKSLINELKNRDGWQPDVIISLAPNCPLRSINDLLHCWQLFIQDENIQAVISVVKDQSVLWEERNGVFVNLHSRKINKRGLRADQKPLFRENGAIYIYTQQLLFNEKAGAENIRLYPMSKRNGMQIITLSDFWAAERLLWIPRIMFFTKGDNKLGMGHVISSLRIAKQIKKMDNIQIEFLMTFGHSEGVYKVLQEGFSITLAKNDKIEVLLKHIQIFSPSIFVIDLPRVDLKLINAIKKLGIKCATVLDSLYDLKGEGILADIIVAFLDEQRDMRVEYFAGPKYTPLDKSFTKLSQKNKNIREKCKNILLTFGGSDPTGLTLKSIDALNIVNGRHEINIVIGPAYTQHKRLKESLKHFSHKYRVYHSPKNIPELIYEADFAICSGGRTIYELAALGTPAIIMSHNRREQRRIEHFQKYKTIISIGIGRNVEKSRLAEVIQKLSLDKSLREKMSIKGKKLIDGRGIERISNLLMNSNSTNHSNGRIKSIS